MCGEELVRVGFSGFSGEESGRKERRIKMAIDGNRLCHSIYLFGDPGRMQPRRVGRGGGAFTVMTARQTCVFRDSTPGRHPARTRVPDGGSSSTGGSGTTPTVIAFPGWPRTCRASSFASFFAVSASFLARFSDSRFSCFSDFSAGAASTGAGSGVAPSDDMSKPNTMGRAREEVPEDGFDVPKHEPPTFHSNWIGLDLRLKKGTKTV